MDSPLPLPAAERAELARLADRMRWIPAESQVAQLAAGVSRLLAHLARVEGEREEARTERDEACAMFGEAHERQKRAESDCDDARADLATCRRALINAGNAVGAKLSDACSTAFLALVQDEVRLVARRLTEERDTARAESARLTRELAEARDALNYLRRKLDEGDALREVADAAEGRATLALAGGGA